MNYFILLSIFPQDIVYYIIQIIKKDNAKNIISNHYYKLKEKHKALKHISLIITNNVLHSFITKKKLTEDFLKSLEIIYKSNYNREKYINTFWICFTDLLSKKLMEFNNYILMNSENNKKNIRYVLLNKCIKLWFKICIKHNIYLSLSFINYDNNYYNNDYIKYYARNIRKINNFLNFNFHPRSLLNNNLYLSKIYSSYLIGRVINE